MVDIVGFANSAPTPTTLTYNGRMLRQMGGVGMAGATAARPLGARSGVRLGTSITTVTASATTWTCGPFAGLADVMLAAESGAYTFSFDANATGSVTAANASFPRRDAIFVQVVDPENGTTTPSAVRGYLAGTVNSGGTLVIAAVPAGAFIVAEINVPISGGGSPTVTWVAPYSAAAGGVLQVRNATERDAGNLLLSQVVWRQDTGAHEVLRGGQWREIATARRTAFSWSRPNVDNAVQYPELVLDSGNSTDTTQATFQRVSGADPDGVAGVKITNPGTYIIQVTLTVAVVTTGRSFVQIGTAGDVDFARSSIGIGDLHGTATSVVRITVANQVAQISFFKANGSLVANTGRVTVTQIS